MPSAEHIFTTRVDPGSPPGRPFAIRAAGARTKGETGGGAGYCPRVR